MTNPMFALAFWSLVTVTAVLYFNGYSLAAGIGLGIIVCIVGLGVAGLVSLAKDGSPIG